MVTKFYSPGGVIFNVLNTISLVFSILITIIISTLFYFSSKLQQRNSLWLQAIIGLIDASRHVQLLFTTGIEEAGFMCPFLGFYTVFGAHMYTFFSASIAFHIHYVYVLEKEMKRHRLIWLVPILSALLVDLIPLFLGAYGITNRKTCNIKSSNENHNLIYFLLFGVVQTPVILYILMVVVLVFTKSFLPPSNDYMLDTAFNFSRITSLTDQIQRNVQFVAIYPLICSFCMSGQIINAYFIYFGNQRKEAIQIWLYFGVSLTGSLNFILLLCDKHIQQAIKIIIGKFFGSNFSDGVTFSNLNILDQTSDFTTPQEEEHHQPLLKFQHVLDNCTRI